MEEYEEQYEEYEPFPFEEYNPDLLEDTLKEAEKQEVIDNILDLIKKIAGDQDDELLARELEFPVDMRNAGLLRLMISLWPSKVAIKN